jgi:hypothetical protein
MTERWGRQAAGNVGRRTKRMLVHIAEMVARKLDVPIDDVLAPRQECVAARAQKSIPDENQTAALRLACFLALLLTSAKPSVIGAVYGNIKGQTVQRLARHLKAEKRTNRDIASVLAELLEEHLNERIATRQLNAHRKSEKLTTRTSPDDPTTGVMR